MIGDDVPWPAPPREVGPWNGGPPVSPPGNTPLPPLPGAGGVVHGAQHQSNPWAAPSPAQPIAPPPPSVNIGGTGRDPFPGLPTSGQPLVDRAPIWLIAASVVIVIAMVAGGVFVLLKGGRQYPSQWDPRVSAITSWVAKERELNFKHPVKVNFLTDKEYTARSTEGGNDTSSESKQYYLDQAAQLRALGFLSGDVDLNKANNTLSDSGTLAYYDPDVEQVFVRGTTLTPGIRVTLAHELTHVLQDQWFDLSRLGSFHDGRDGVLRALGEGDATKVEDAYVEKVLTKEERAEYQKESRSSGDEAQTEIDKSVPPILTTLFSAPYILGPQLIDMLDQRDGWKAINTAIKEPPTEEVLFDPLTYDTPAADAKHVTVATPKGAEVIDRNEFGPTTWYLMLAARIDARTALAATDGWGGDAYIVYRQAKKVCVDVAVEGDSKAQTDELARALVTWVSKSPKGSASVTNTSGRVHFTSCDPGTDAKPAGGAVTPDLLSLPVTRTQLYLQALEAGRDEKQSRCFAQGVLDRFTFAQISDRKGTYVNSPAGQQKLKQLRDQCFG